jgi:hypothetical protein
MKRLTVLPWLLWAVIAAFAIAFIFHAGRASAELRPSACRTARSPSRSLTSRAS